METEKEIEEAVNRLKRGIEDTLFSTLYSQEEEERDIKIVLEHLKNVKADLYEANNIISDYIDTTTKQEKTIELIKTRIYVSSEEHEQILKIQEKHRDKSYEDCTLEYFEKKAEESEQCK